ncbi:YopX family protein [uncultured Enterococcus sp.]|uniref:YopX family protein n=1 Tax=uncultured Enterococcus sp. TaxID=167972 RepID=UPI002593187C|nr:YopX family protein [uncultured Enterococcus sp.]
MKPKFRAYWEHTHQTSEVTEINYKGNWVCDEPYVVVDGRCDLIPLRECTLMQSTGLKDKNGVEIFEGDIVRYTWDMLSDVNATEKGKKVRISKVFWSDWRASWAIGKKCCNNDLFRYVINGNTVEVIGDIYTNPELLEVIK